MGRLSLILKTRKNRLYQKILLYFLSLLIPIIVIGIVTYIYSANLMENDFKVRISSNLGEASDTVELYIKMAKETSLNFFYDDEVQSLLWPKEKQTDDIKADLWKIPKAIQKSENIVSGFVDGIFVYNDNKSIYVNSGKNDYNTFFRNFYHYLDYDADFWSNKLLNERYFELLPVTTVIREDTQSRKDVVPIVMVQKINGANAVMVVNISVDAIVKTLKGNAVFKSTGFFVLDGDNNLIFSVNDYFDYSKIRDAIDPDIFKKKEFFNLSLKDGNYILTCSKSDMYGWKYYSITPLNEFSKRTFSILEMTAILCIVLIIMGIIFSFIFSSSIYNPIKNIRDIVMEKEELWQQNSELEKTNELEMIRRGISKLSDDHLQYKFKHDKYTNEYIEYSFLFLLKGHMISQEKILMDTLKEEFGFDKSGYVCCNILFEYNEKYYEDIQDNERIFINDGIKKVIWAILQDKFRCYILEYKKDLYVSIINIDSVEEISTLNDMLQYILDTFEYDSEYCDIIIGIGKLHFSINRISDSYNEAMTAISTRNKDKRFQMINADSLSIENNLFYSLYDEQKILNCIKAQDKEGFKKVIDEIINVNVSKGISYEHMKLLFKELYTTGIRFYMERGLDITELHKQNPLFSMWEKDDTHHFISLNEMEKTILCFYDDIIDMLKSQSSNKSGNLVSMIIRYIEENYTKNLCLEQIADEMGVSVKYVSRVFKEKTGMYLSDFINKVRIDKAKEMLVTTNLNISEISLKIGIESRTTFLRVFKKVEGISPNEYRIANKK